MFSSPFRREREKAGVSRPLSEIDPTKCPPNRTVAMLTALTTTALAQTFRPRCHATPSAHFASCFDSHCCADPRTFACFHRPDRPSIAQCLPYARQVVNGTCVDTDQWLCPETWLKPPPPPLPPSPLPLSPPPSLPPLPPEAEPWHRCHAEPSEHFGSCMESKCCKDSKRYGCFRKRNKVWAACLPLEQQIPEGGIRCVDNDEWLCPSTWLVESPPPPPPPPSPPPFRARCSRGEAPAAHFASCMDTHCCADPRAFGCFKKVGKSFAQCLPLHQMLRPDGSCIDNEQWLCPESWLEPPPPPAAPSPPPVMEGCFGATPSENYASCFESRARHADASCLHTRRTCTQPIPAPPPCLHTACHLFMHAQYHSRVPPLARAHPRAATCTCARRLLRGP